MGLASTETVFNEDSVDVDFRVESNNDANAFFVEGSTGNIGIGTAAPAGDFHLTDTADIRMLFTSDQTGNTAGDGTFIGLTDGGHFSIFNREATSTRLLTSGVVGLQLNSAGIVTMPLQPAFSAIPASNQNNIALNQLVDIAFGTEKFDVGGNFASSTFTAPVTGKSSLHVHLRLQNVDSAAAYYILRINTTLEEYQSLFSSNQFNADLAYWPIAMNCLANMDEGDTAVITLYQSGGTAQTDISTESYFNGILVA